MMKERVKVRTEEKETTEQTKPQCGHYWVIEVANGPTSVGECKFCGMKKEFYNAFPDFNPLRRSHTNPMVLPELPEVEVEKESKS